MPEYADTVGPTRAYIHGNDGYQPGDPAKAGRTIVEALDADDPPLRLLLGADATAGVAQRLSALSEELEAWRAVGEDTAV